MAREEQGGDIEDVCELLRQHARQKNHVVLEIYLRFGRPVGVVKESRTTLVGEIKAKRLKSKKSPENPEDPASDSNS